MVIKELFLKQYGKFKNRRLPFSSVTLFYGKNEAGKSTLFDAITQSLSKPDGRSALGRKLNARFGADRELEVEGNIPNSIDQDEFIHLHSIKAGEIGMDFSKGDWMEGIKKQLFSGGIDPVSLSKEIQKGSSTSMTMGHMKDKKKLDDACLGLDAEIKEIKRTKENLLNQEKQIFESESNKDQLQEELNLKKEQLKKLDAQWKLQELIQEKQRLAKIVKNISSWKNNQAEWEGLKNFNDSNRNSIQKWEETRLAMRTNLENLSERKLQTQNRLNLLKENSQSKELKFNKLTHLEILARSIKQRVEEKIAHPAMIENWEKNRKLFPISLAIILLGTILTGFGLDMKAYLLWIGISITVGGLVCLALSFSRVKTKDTQEESRFLKTLLLEWKESLPKEEVNDSNLIPGEDTDIQRFRDFLFQFLNERKASHQEMQSGLREIKSINEELSQLASRESEIHTKLTQIEQSVQDLFRDLGIHTKDEFFQKYNRASGLVELIRSQRKDLESTNSDQSIENLEWSSHRRLNTLEEQNIPDLGMEESELKKLKTSINDLNNEIQVKSNSLQNMSLDTTRDRASLEASLSPLSEKLLHKEMEYLKLKERSKNLERTRLAHEITAKIFAELGNEANDSFEALSEEIQKSGKLILGEQRKIEFSDLSGNIKMEDAGGEMRSINDLSLGTRDSFYIAAKLSLCEKRDPDLKIFVMDEPFLSLDDERERFVIQILKDYVEKKNWQIVILSKEERLSENLKEAFPDRFMRVEL